MKPQLYKVVKVTLQRELKGKCLKKFKCKGKAEKYMLKQKRKSYEQGQRVLFFVMKD
jgi:hypothetical protein